MDIEFKKYLLFLICYYFLHISFVFLNSQKPVYKNKLKWKMQKFPCKACNVQKDEVVNLFSIECLLIIPFYRSNIRVQIELSWIKYVGTIN